MKLYFEIKSPNFAITDKGKFSLSDLDDDDFNEYLDETQRVIVARRNEQIEQKRSEMKPGRGVRSGN